MAVANSAISTCAHHHLSTTEIIQKPIVSHTIPTDTTFTRSGMARYSLKFLIYTPNLG